MRISDWSSDVCSSDLLWSRGFNQAALIAAAMTKASGVASDPTLLVRRRRTPPLRGMGPRARAKTVAGAFEVPDRATTALGGKHVVLIDDVHTKIGRAHV